MSKLNGFMGFVGAAILSCTSVGAYAHGDGHELSGHGNPTEGVVTVTNYGDQLTIHSFTAPEDSSLVNSHIIETSERLIMVDGQFFRDYATQLRDYVDGIGKPLDRVYLSHQHPDHWFGLEKFAGTPVHALPEVAAELEKKAGMFIKIRRKEFGERVTETPVKVDEIISANSVTIDGVKIEFELVKEAEADYQTIFKLPQHKVAIVQDIVSNNAHAFFAKMDFSGWQSNLEMLRNDYQDWTFYVGHGYPGKTDANAVIAQQEYLRAGDKIVHSPANVSPEAMNEAMLAEYPELGATPLVKISSFFFHKVVKKKAAQAKQ